MEAFIFIHQHLNRDINFIFTNQPELTTYGVPTALKSLMFSIYGYVAQTERETNSVRTKMGLARAKANGKKLGRPKGSTGFSKLDGKEQLIKDELGFKVSLTSICKKLECSVPTLRSFIASRMPNHSDLTRKITVQVKEAKEKQPFKKMLKN